MKNIFRVFVLLFITNMSFGQPNPCGDTPIMANNCMDACVVCDINGYTGINNLQNGGQDIGNIFCSMADDMHFIAFIAGSTSLSIQISVNNCTSGSVNLFSLDIGFYESLDCQTFTPITECKQDIGNGQSYIFNTTTPLTIGQYYYVVMDGSGGSICNWTFTVLGGTTSVNSLVSSGDIIGNTSFCAEDEQLYEVDFPIGATDFDWTLQGLPIGDNSSSINYQFADSGSYQLCVTSSNACSVAPPTCLQVNVESVPVTEIEDTYCASECYLYAGDTICLPGTYEYVFDNQNGCDSTVVLNLEEWETPLLNLDLNICDGDTITIGNTPYTSQGQFQTILTTVEGCDSIVNLDLGIILCNIMSTDIATPAICFGTATGKIDFIITNGTPPFTYDWENFNGTPSGIGNLNMINQVETIDNLPIGSYIITIQDGFGNSEIIISEITEPTQMLLDFSLSNYGANNISCAGEADGSVSVSVTGGEPVYGYLWSNNGTFSSIQNIEAGNYAVTVTDMVGCELIKNFELTEPDSITLIIQPTDPGCEGNMTGSIVISELSGGTNPYSFFINDVLHDNTTFANLGTGEYVIKVVDENGCENQKIGQLIAAEIPTFELGGDQSLTLGESTNIYPVLGSFMIQSINWTSTENVDCDTCLDISIMPLFSASYTLEITSEDGCSRSKSIFVRVLEDRRVFVPTAFSPNYDGENDYFTIFGSMPNVQEIEEFAVFDRWGGLLFENKNFLPNIETEGWDGKSNGEELDNGVYMYYAKVRFWDNVVIVYKGDLSLLR